MPQKWRTHSSTLIVKPIIPNWKIIFIQTREKNVCRVDYSTAKCIIFFCWSTFFVAWWSKKLLSCHIVRDKSICSMIFVPTSCFLSSKGCHNLPKNISRQFVVCFYHIILIYMHLPTWTKKKEKTHNDSIIKVLQSPPFLILHHSQVVARSLFFSITSSSLAYLSPSQTPPHRARKQSNEIESKKSAIVQCITYWGGLLPTCLHPPPPLCFILWDPQMFSNKKRRQWPKAMLFSPFFCFFFLQLLMKHDRPPVTHSPLLCHWW